ncbi:MAG: LacI family DNA-binding transcriptional regulator [Gaiellaceae bacterium]
MASGQTTISQVAAHAGVSTTTVSRFLNGERVRAGDAVRSAIAELRFSPSRAARSLKSGLTHSIGVVVPDITNPFFAAVVKGAESISRQGDYNIFVCNTEESQEREEAVLLDLVGRVDGVILAPATEPSEMAPVLREPATPIVFLDRELDSTDAFDSVLVDNEGGARAAVEHLLALGHERIGLISGPLDTTPGRGRHDGFVAALEQAGIEVDPALAQHGDFRQESGYQGTLRLLALEQPPTAILSANNLMTIGALRALHAMRVSIPRDLSLIGFDDLELAELLSPPLTVVDRPMEEQGALAMRLLLARIESRDPVAPQQIVLETRLRVRASTAAPKRKDAT